MKEIKSIRVRRIDLSTDNLSTSIDYKVTLLSDGNKNFKVVVSQPGRSDLFSEYKKEGRFKKFSNDDFIKNGIDILIASNLNNKSSLGGGSGMGQLYFEQLEMDNILSGFDVVDNNIVYKIIQDPWLETPPPFRNFGFDPYYINNGSTIIIRWLKEDISGGVVNSGGFKWSDDNGNELSISNNVDSKKNIYKTVMIISPDDEKYYIISQGSPFFSKKMDNILKFSGENTDISIIDRVLNMWTNNVFTKIFDRYSLSICNPSYKSCEIIPYIDPIDNGNIEKLEDDLEKKVEKKKLNIIIPKDLKLKIKEDFSFKIFVGDPPKTELPAVDGFDFGDEEDFSDLLLEDEFREVEFDAEEESPSNLIEIPPEETKKEHAGEGISSQDVFIPGKGLNSFILPKTYSNTKKQGFNLLNSGWIGNLIKSAKIHVGTPTYDIPFTDNGNLGCAAGVSIIFYRAFGVSIINGKPVKDNPTSISSFGSLGTLDLNNAFKNNPNLYQKRNNWKDAKPGDIINTSRGRKSGHIGIVIDEKSSNGSWVVISNSSKGFEGGGGGAIKRNYSIKAWESVATRNPTETFAYYYIGPTLSGKTTV